jgi:hypothetical protein
MLLPCPVSHCPTIPLLHPTCKTQSTTFSCVPLSHCPTVPFLHSLSNTHATTLSCVPLSHYPTPTSIMEHTCHYRVLCPTVPLLRPSLNTHATILLCVPLSHCYIHHGTHMPLPCSVSHCPTATSIMSHTCHYLALCPTNPLLHLSLYNLSLPCLGSDCCAATTSRSHP